MLIAPAYEGHRAEALGLGYLSAIGKKAGLNVRVLNAGLLGLDDQAIINEAMDLKPEIVGVSLAGYGHPAARAIRTVRRIKEYLSPPILIIGGYGPSFLPELYLRLTGADVCVIGEGEAAFERIVVGSSDWASIPGIAIADRGGYQITGAGELVADLDSLPFPDRDSTKRVKAKEAHVSTSRGCYGRCRFCSIQTFYGTNGGPGGGRLPLWRARSPDSVVEELKALARMGFTRIAFVDDNFIGPGDKGKQRAAMIAEGLIKGQLGISFRMMCRASDVDAATIRLLQRAGLNRVHLGVESLSISQLKRYGKQVRPGEIIKAIETLQRIGVTYTTSLIPWDPLTTPGELIETFEGLLEAGPSPKTDSLLQVIGNRLVLFPGTPISRDLAQQLSLSLDEDFERALADPTSEFLTYPWGFQNTITRASFEAVRSWIDDVRRLLPNSEFTSPACSKIVLAFAKRSVCLALKGEDDELTLSELKARVCLAVKAHLGGCDNGV